MSSVAEFYSRYIDITQRQIGERMILRISGGSAAAAITGQGVRGLPTPDSKVHRSGFHVSVANGSIRGGEPAGRGRERRGLRLIDGTPTDTRDGLVAVAARVNGLEKE